MVDTDAFRSITLLHSEDCVGGAWWNHTLYDKRNIVFCCMCDIYTRSKTWKYSRINYEFISIKRMLLVSYGIIYWLLSNRHSIGISVFTSYWDLCIAWIMCICVLYKSLCILCDAIFAYKNRDVYWRFCRIICIYSIWKRTFS